MKNIFVVCYDISDPKRLRKVFKLMQGFGEHIQYSVFRCSLTAMERATLEGRLGEIIHHREDSVILVHLGPNSAETDARFTTMGRGTLPPKRSSVII